MRRDPCCVQVRTDVAVAQVAAHAAAAAETEAQAAQLRDLHAAFADLADVRGPAGVQQLLRRYQERDLAAVRDAEALRGEAHAASLARIAAEAATGELRAELDVRLVCSLVWPQTHSGKHAIRLAGANIRCCCDL